MCSHQLSLFSTGDSKEIHRRPVNVSSVPQRSPFRYPGGKTWFVPTFRNWIRSLGMKPQLLVEPFAGGGIISLTALFENHVDSAVMAELDDGVAAVWETVVNGNAKWMANRIMEFDLSIETLVRELSESANEQREIAFQTILKNRTSHGGILAKGSGLLKNGENGKGVGSRWYPKTLARRFIELDFIADRLEFLHEDGMEIIRRYSNRDDVIFFIDPPYTAGGKKAGKRLYRHWDINHEKLFSLCDDIKGQFLITYDDSEEVKAMVREHGFQMRLIPMSNTHNVTKEELVISRNMAWMDDYQEVHKPCVKYNQ
ncbi:MAG: DNA adenine methylase [Candidatus Cloacimonetes bacterium]|nr:DNA adenine methylase [Candidatus Cloacimonadota bacterium]